MGLNMMGGLYGVENSYRVLLASGLLGCRVMRV